MSAAVPYVAPWAANWTRYSVQLVTPTTFATGGANGHKGLQVTVPDGQWWRLIFATGQASTSANPGNRIVAAQALNADGSTALTVQSTAPMAAGRIRIITALTTGSSFTDTTSASAEFSQLVLPDLMWPQGSVLQLFLNGTDTTDSFGTLRVFAVEIYTEQRDEHGPILVPTPLLV